MSGKRIGYGLNRKPADFAEARTDKLWLDTSRTSRVEFEDMVRFAVRPGDTIVVLRISDLGAGKGLRNFRAAMEKRGVNIEVHTPKGEMPKKVGRPAKGKLTDEQIKRFKRLWKDPATQGKYLIQQACEAMGEDPNDAKARERVRQRLHRKFGARET